MDKVISVETKGDITSIVIDTKKPSIVNILKRAILSEIETYAIDVVIFDTNTSARYDEIIALRLGQLAINHTKLTSEDREFKGYIDFTGPGELTSDDIQGIPFAYKTPIVTLLKNQSVKCQLIAKKNIGRTHVKWRPVSTVSITEVENGYRLAYKSIGMMSGDQIFREAQAKMENVLEREPINLFFSLIIDL